MPQEQLPSSFDGKSDFYDENRWEKITRRLKEEPLIPLGCILTCMALVGATRSMRSGDHNRTQRMFRARLAAQTFTLGALLAGSAYYSEDRKKRKEFDGILAEKKAKEKNEAWIRELEARDEEDRREKEARDRRRRGGDKGSSSVRETVGRVVNKTQAAVEPATTSLPFVERQAGDENTEAGEAVVNGKGEEKVKGVLESVKGLIWGEPKK